MADEESIRLSWILIYLLLVLGLGLAAVMGVGADIIGTAVPVSL